MPSDYTYKKRVGAFITDGSSTFKRITQKGTFASYVPTTATNTTVYPQFGSSPVTIATLIAPTAELACVSNTQVQGTSNPWYLSTSPLSSYYISSGGAWSGVGMASNSVTWFVPVQSTIAYTGQAPVAVGWSDNI